MNQLNASIEKLKSRENDIEKYASIMSTYNQTDIANDEDFQKTFTSFYKVRRNADWRGKYYTAFQEIKNCSNVNFECILRRIYEETGRVEASFSSKMLATFDPEAPIWDSIVLARLEIKPSNAKDKNKKIEQTIEKYNKLCDWYKTFKKNPKAKSFVDEFNKNFPKYKKFSKTKKIDFIIWASGDASIIPKQ